jgi:hypothetical protein
MRSVSIDRSIRGIVMSLLISIGFFTMSFGADMEMHKSHPFTGVKANTGTVTHSKNGNQNVLTLSDDFKVPDAPAPHWQVVDSKGNVYLLQRLVVKGEKFNKSIVVPSYVPDIAKVQIWCAWAEVLLGEATFDSPVM